MFFVVVDVGRELRELEHPPVLQSYYGLCDKILV